MQTQSKIILYLSYGEGLHAYETVFSALTLQRFDPGELRGIRAVVMTDHPEFYEECGLETDVISGATLSEWQGPRKLGHRCKIMALRSTLGRFGGRCLMVDGDTYFTRPPAALFRRIGPGRTLQHIKEGQLGFSRLEINRRLGEALQAREALRGLDQADRPPRGPLTMQWNAGVIGIHASDARLLDDVLALTDEILEDCFTPLAEQAAFSMILAEKTRLRAAYPWIFHYNVSHERKSFGAKIPKLLDESKGMPLAERAGWLYQRRIVLPWRVKARILAKDVLNATGLLRRRDRYNCV